MAPKRPLDGGRLELSCGLEVDMVRGARKRSPDRREFEVGRPRMLVDEASEDARPKRPVELDGRVVAPVLLKLNNPPVGCCVGSAAGSPGLTSPGMGVVDVPGVVLKSPPIAGCDDVRVVPKRLVEVVWLLVAFFPMPQGLLEKRLNLCADSLDLAGSLSWGRACSEYKPKLKGGWLCPVDGVLLRFVNEPPLPELKRPPNGC